ncbi:hypothetical protein Q2T83_13845 [Fervidibacter sacchari]|uniref:Uncharacterized protein n=1 Tax=Candidatus Fervidibacter sacchari TaxID=1448929 RepID=A0ABT2EPS3_9BACT|nr:hypothetical protein [Candidatus Fervidibacter sacchari]MCS3919689.1 hypothetical protein [Candidatus Fervidibacter sacchari]WKU15405.1 hypothetical protein Q2T83_13845 [Candidatus Fervidibacter sacchari]
MRAWLLMGVMLMSSVVAAFDPPVAKVGDFTLRIDAPQLVTQLETPIPVRIHLSNAGSQTLRGKVRLQVIDRWRITSPNPQSFKLTPKSEQVLEFTVVAGKGTHNAHYPIHAFAEWDGGRGAWDEGRAHAVLVVEVRVPRKPKTPKEKVVRLPERGSVPLWQQGNHQVSFQVFGQPMQTMPMGWWGTDEATGAHATLQRVDRSGTKDAIAIHPPWRKGAGTIFVDWQVALPKTKPIWLDFAFAIRDHDPQREPPSDGVTVRVWVKRQTDERRSEVKKRKSSAIVTNPSRSGQIGKAVMSQETKQFSVSRPVSRPNLLRHDQVKGIVVTDPPTQCSLKNFFCVPINAAGVDAEFSPEVQKSGENGCRDRASLTDGFHQATQNFVFKPIGHMGNNFATVNVQQHPHCAIGDSLWLIQKHRCQKDRSVQDDFDLLVSHPLANSLCFSMFRKNPRPLKATRVCHHCLNSSSLIVPLRNASNIWATSFLASSSFASNALSLGCGFPLDFAIAFHPQQPLWREGKAAVVTDPTDSWFSQLPASSQKLVKASVCRPENSVQFACQNEVDGVIVTAPLCCCHCPDFLWRPVSVMPMHESVSEGKQIHEPSIGFLRTNGSGFISVGTPSGHGFPQRSPQLICPSVWDVGLHQPCSDVSKQLQGAQPLLRRFTSQRHSEHADRCIHHIHDSSPHPRAFALCCERASNAASMNSRLATPQRCIRFNHHSHAASGPFVSFNSRSFLATYSRSLRNLATFASNEERFEELFAFAMSSHLAPQLCHLVAFDGGGAPTQNGDDGWQLLYERHSDSKVWVPARVDLSDFAGQRVILRIEVHPGPRNDTTCDTAFIGEPYLVAGRTPPDRIGEPKPDERLVLTVMTRWKMVEAAENWGLLPRSVQTVKDLAALKLLAPMASSPDELKRVNELARKLLAQIKLPKGKQQQFFAPPKGSQPAVWVIAHDGELTAFALLPPKEGGWWDAKGAIVFADRELSFDGFDLRVLGDNLSDWRSPSVLLSRSEKVEGNRLIANHRMERNGIPYTLTMLAWSEGGTLKVRWQLSTTAPQDKHQPLRITDCAVRSWSEIAERIYIGHGNVIVRPQSFRLHADGHRLSTRHAGMDFANGVSVVVGVDNPPDFFECQPTMRHYSIHAHMDMTFTIAASAKNVWVAAKRYREVDPYKPAPTLAKLAGRFVFDLWGGWRYARVAEQLEKAFRYGCTDALVIYHNWQRWGYDYRLPDIFPPNPQFGTLEDFVKMVEICNRYGVLFATHDNYIDFYPDAEGFSYRHICFTPDGSPVRAWFNEWRQAQSYRWRPDAFFPFMERNLKLIAKHIRPTAYFVDVFSSIGMFDWWTEDGEFHSILETQRRWGESFNFIRKILGNAPQTSESGCDWLIGWLDGATTNHLRVDPNAPPGQWAVWRIRCEDAERIPWFDFAHHHKFALHGAGYSNRYQGGLPYEVAGIYSDDYICTEVLTGHPAMVSEPFGPQVVRKYWLLAELGRALALAEMSSVEFADGDIHRQIVRWQLAPRPPSRVPAEATVWVNRSGSDWKVNNRTLPPFGFYALVHIRSSSRQSPIANRSLEVAIEKLPTVDGDKVIAEWALSEQFAYCNARTQVLFGWMPIQLIGAQVRWLGNRRFELELRWRADRPTSEPHHVFVHFVNPKSKRGEQIAFQGDHAPDVQTTQWHGEILTRTVVTVPQDWGADRYGVRVGLWNPKTGYRLRLMGDSDDTLRLVAGDLILEGRGDQITNARLEPNPNLTKLPEWLNRWNTQGKLVDFGFAVTDGAFRFDRKTLTLIPLPDHQPFTVTLRLDKLLGKNVRIAAVEAIDEGGKVISKVQFTQILNEVTFKTQAGVFGYRLVAEVR